MDTEEPAPNYLEVEENIEAVKNTAICIEFYENSEKRLINYHGELKTTDCLSRLGTQHSYNTLLQNKNIFIPCSAILYSIVVLLLYW